MTTQSIAPVQAPPEPVRAGRAKMQSVKPNYPPEVWRFLSIVAQIAARGASGGEA